MANPHTWQGMTAADDARRLEIIGRRNAETAAYLAAHPAAVETAELRFAGRWAELLINDQRFTVPQFVAILRRWADSIEAGEVTA